MQAVSFSENDCSKFENNGSFDITIKTWFISYVCTLFPCWHDEDIIWNSVNKEGGWKLVSSWDICYLGLIIGFTLWWVDIEEHTTYVHIIEPRVYWKYYWRTSRTIQTSLSMYSFEKCLKHSLLTKKKRRFSNDENVPVHAISWIE